MTAYLVELPLGVGCVSGVKVAKGAGCVNVTKGAGEVGEGVIVALPDAGVMSVGSGEPRNKVGVTVTNGACEVGVPCAGAQALSARINRKTGKVFVFMIFSFGRSHSRIIWV
jgi:transketolase N-terminal domain/subunit